MNFYVILRGPAGSGKTTLAGELAEIYDGVHISIDKVKKGLGLKHSEPEKLRVNRVVIPYAKERLDEGKVVIIEEVIYYESQLSELEKLPYDKYIFTLTAPVETCLERNKERRQSRGRSTTDADVRLVHDLVSQLKKGIEISTQNRTVRESLNEILSYLPKMQETSHQSNTRED